MERGLQTVISVYFPLYLLKVKVGDFYNYRHNLGICLPYFFGNYILINIFFCNPLPRCSYAIVCKNITVVLILVRNWGGGGGLPLATHNEVFFSAHLIFHDRDLKLDMVIF